MPELRWHCLLAPPPQLTTPHHNIHNLDVSLPIDSDCIPSVSFSEMQLHTAVEGMELILTGPVVGNPPSTLVKGAYQWLGMLFTSCSCHSLSLVAAPPLFLPRGH